MSAGQPGKAIRTMLEVTRDTVTETNGDPDHLIEEATEVLLVESDPGWRVIIEHVGCDSLIQVARDSHDDAVTLIDQIEEALSSGKNRIRIAPAHIVSLVAFRQAWVDQPHGRHMTATDPS